MSAIYSLHRGDALIIVDVQNDFLPGGSLGVRDGDQVVPVLNRYIDAFVERRLPIYATRDWHPPDHCSFRAQGGPWPVHCVADSEGAAFAAALRLPSDVTIVPKGVTPARDAYSGFSGTELAHKLRTIGAQRLFIGGLATDYCVLCTVRDALALDFEVYLLTDAIRAVDVQPGDGERAIGDLRQRGATPITIAEIS